MGNRAILKPVGKNVGIYLHWNGGPDSVKAFLEYCKLKEYRPFGGKEADGYGFVRLCQVISNFFGGSSSIGLETDVFETDEYVESSWLDNGMYVIDGWDVVRRIGYESGSEGYDLQEFLCDIDAAQPEKEQLGREYICAEIVDASELCIGDKVFVSRYERNPEIHTVVGIAPPDTFNNGDKSNCPYVDMYDHDGDYSWNCNNYITGKIRLYRRAENEEVTQ